MSALAEAFVIYACTTGIVGAMVHAKGRSLQKIAPFEFLFLFLPWLALLLLAVAFFGSIEIFAQRGGMWLLFWLLQAFSAGIVGGFVLMPRYFVKAETVVAKLLVNTVAGAAFSVLFAYTRLSLFAISATIEV